MDGQTLRGKSDSDQWSSGSLAHKDSLPLKHSGDSSPASPPRAYNVGQPQDVVLNGPQRHRKPSATASLQPHRALLGLQPTAPLQEEHDAAWYNHLWWSKIKITFKEPFAEMWGTFILVLFGCGGIAQVSLSKNSPNSPDGFGYGDWQSINWAFGLGLMLGVYVAGDSGAYLNPAVTLTSCMLRKLPWRRLPMYMVAQILGAFIAAGVVYANYINAINAVEGHNVRTVTGPNATAGIFATYPTSDLDGVKASQFFEQFIASAVLNFVIFAMQDDSNKGQFVASGAWFPLGLFFPHVRHRLLLRLADRLRHQPRTRLWPTPHVLLRRVRQRSLVRGQLLLLDPHGGSLWWLSVRRCAV